MTSFPPVSKLNTRARRLVRGFLADCGALFAFGMVLAFLWLNSK